MGGVEGQNLHDLLIQKKHQHLKYITLFSSERLDGERETHLLAGQGSAGLKEGLCICLCLFPRLQQLNSLDQRLQCGHSATCLQTAATQPLLQQAHIVALVGRKAGADRNWLFNHEPQVDMTTGAEFLIIPYSLS